MKLVKITAAIIFALFTVPTAAQAFDIPLLTWERGRTQQVVLGGGATSANFKVQLEGNGIKPLLFVASSVSQSGYVVYTLDIPADIELGAYSISAASPGAPPSVVAGVAIIQAATKTATSSLLDLMKIVSILIFLTALTSTLRSRKYSVLTFTSTQELPVEDLAVENQAFADRFMLAPERIRVRTLMSFQQSLLRFLFIREGELIHRLNRTLYGSLPFIGLIVGSIAGIETIRNNGLAKTGLSIFIVVTVISIIDSISGVFAIAGFWAVQLFTGNITSVRDVLIAFAIALSWIGTSLFSSIIRQSFFKDVSQPEKVNITSKYFSTLYSAAVGTLIFYLAHNLADSVIYIEAPARKISSMALAVIFGALLLRGIADTHILENENSNAHSENFRIARVSSPRSAIALNTIFFAFIYIWTESAGKALVVSILFAIPYYLIFIQFNSRVSLSQLRIKRSLLIEPLLVTVAGLIAFRQISLQPLLSDQRTQLMLVVSAIPGAVHAAYSAICSSDEKKAIINS